MKLTVRRSSPMADKDDESTTTTSDSEWTVLMVNLNDNRFGRPIFDHSIYNFTIDENTNLGTIIGELNAIYLHRPSGENDTMRLLLAEEENSIRYRIVPLAEDGAENSVIMMATNDEAADFFSSALPVGIDAETGRLSVRLNIDREKFLTSRNPRGGGSYAEIDGSRGDENQLGLIRFNVEASYASTYSYAKVREFFSWRANPRKVR